MRLCSKTSYYETHFGSSHVYNRILYYNPDEEWENQLEGLIII